MNKEAKFIQVIVNPVAGEDDTVISALNDALHESALSWGISVTHKYGDGARLAKEAVAAGVDIIAVYGGDGTIGDVLNGLYPYDIPLAILSGGTGNGVARVLNIPADLSDSAKYLASGDYDLIKADIGRIKDRLFLLRVDVGKLVEIVNELDRDAKDDYGIFGYYYAVARAYAGDNDTTFRFSLDHGDTIEREGTALVLLNLREKNPQTPHENIQNSKFEFFFIRSGMINAAKGVATYMDLFETDDMYEIFSATHIKIEQPEAFTVLADGEPCGETPLEIDLIPQAVTLVVPRQ